MEERKIEPYLNRKLRLKKNGVSTRRRIKLLSALHAKSYDEQNENTKLEGSFDCDVSSHGKAVLSLMQNELFYLDNLQELQKFLLHPRLKGTMLSLEELSDLVGEMLSIHQEMYQALLHVHLSVAEILQSLYSHLKLYRAYFILIDMNYSTFQEFSYLNEELKVPVHELLYEPVTQISRYKSTLQHLLAAMPEENVYKDILSALNHLTESVKSTTSLKQQTLRVLQIQRLLVNRQPKLLAFCRTLLKEGILCQVKIRGNGLKDRAVFLFSDVFLCCRMVGKHCNMFGRNSLKCCSLLPLSRCSVHTVMGKTALFKVICGDVSHLFLSETPVETQHWVQEIQNAIHACSESRMEAKANLNLKRNACIKQKRSPLLRRPHASEKTVSQTLKNPNVSNTSVSSKRGTTFRSFTKFLSCGLGV